MGREKGMGSLQREKSGRWTARVGFNGKRLSRSTGTTDRQKAEQFLQRLLAPLGLGERRVPLNDAWRQYLVSPKRRELAKATLETKRNTWFQFAHWMEAHHPEVTQLAHITDEIVGEYLTELKFDHCASTYNGRVCILREVFRTLADKAGVLEDPWEGVVLLSDDSHPRRELGVDELKRLLAAAEQYGVESLTTKNTKDHKEVVVESEGYPTALCNSVSFVAKNNSEWKVLFLIGIYTGLRLGDCCLLEWKDVFLDRGIIQVIPRKTRKHAHGVPVTIPIHPQLAEALRGMVAVPSATANDHTAEPSSESGGVGTHRPTGYVGVDLPYPSSFIPHPSQYVLQGIAETYLRSRWQVAHSLELIFKAAGIKTSVMIEGRSRATPEATFHSLRHTFVSLSANAGVPLTIIASIVGHSSTAMTRHYYHENEEALRRAVAAIPALW